ncbi:MAG: hypothetical protein JNM83_04325 [Myxococcales bacterium]|nr:hypothetical protein [Myxococcales bacterium]
MQRRVMTLVGCAFLAMAAATAFSGPQTAYAQPAKSDAGPVERSVITKDGSMYRGEVLEYAINSHITLRLSSGESKRIGWDDIDQVSPPRPKSPSASSPPPSSAPPSSPPPSSTPPSSTPPSSMPPSSMPPPSAPSSSGPLVGSGFERTVQTRDNITYHGEVMEYEVGSHLILKLGDLSNRRITWAEAKRISPPRKKGDSGHVGSPERTIVLRSGTTLRGDLVESVQGIHTTIRLGSGEIRRVLWSDIQRITAPLAPGVSSPIPLTGELLVHLDSGSRVLGTYFEYIPEQQLILRHPSGRIYYIPVNTIIKVTITDEGKTE